MLRRTTLVSYTGKGILSFGTAISPLEIEEVILQMESVTETAVVGQPDDVLGEVVVAFIVPSNKGEIPS